MKKKVWIGIGIVVLIIALVAINVYRTTAKKNVDVKVTELKSEEISENVMTPGTLKLGNEQEIYFNPEKGEIKEILVKKGDKVKKGKVLIRYVNEALELEKEQNALQIESDYLKINNLDKQQDRLKEKEADLEKQMGKKEAEKTIEPEYDQLQMEKRMANIELKQALLQKDVIDKKVKALEIKSKIDGVVLNLTEIDDIQGQELTSKPIIQIGSKDNLIVEGLISEYDTLNVKEGQKVTLRTDVLPDKEWKGEVQEVSYLPEEQVTPQANQTTVQYPVTVKVTDKEMALKPGFQIIMDIETEKHQALTLPMDAIKQKNNKQIVYVVKEGKAYEKTIEVGVATNESIEIISGIKENEKVILNPPDSIKDGMDVTVQ